MENGSSVKIVNLSLEHSVEQTNENEPIELLSVGGKIG